MTQGRPTITVEVARELDWRSARMECLREAIVVLEAAVRNPDLFCQREENKDSLRRLLDGLAERERKPF